VSATTASPEPETAERPHLKVAVIRFVYESSCNRNGLDRKVLAKAFSLVDMQHCKNPVLLSLSIHEAGDLTKRLLKPNKILPPEHPQHTNSKA
jgi:hypothetical protein